MRKTVVLFVLAVLMMSVLNSCYKDLDRVLFGTWTVTKVEGTLNVNGSSVFSGVDEDPVGTIVFENSGKGEQNYSFTFNGTVYPQTGTFTWTANEDEIIVDRASQPDMIWTRIIDSDNRQKVSHNVTIDATQNWDYTITLEK